MKDIADLGTSYWLWRSSQQPRTHDDIPRIERPANWIPKWSPEDVKRYKSEIVEFKSQLDAIHVGSSSAPIVDKSDWVDYQLLSSAISRVHFELDILQTWAKQPRFYIDQTIGVIFDLLTVPNVDNLRVEQVIAVLKATPGILNHGIQNLTNNALAEYAEITISDLAIIDEQIEKLILALLKFADTDTGAELKIAGAGAVASFLEFKAWLVSNKSSMKNLEPIGVSDYNWFFHNVALYPYSADEILAIGTIEWDRAVTYEKIVKNKYRNEPIPPLPQTSEEQVKNEEIAEASVRNFYETEGLLSQPQSLKHYLNAPMPDYLEPLRWLGVSDDLTGPSRLSENSYSYMPAPHPSLPYFYAANARDTRAGIVHEGAHYQQLAISWAHPRQIRRHYYDSGVNEGIAFYNEEMMLLAGLFDDAPLSQIVMWNFMKLRALRVIVDVNLATGRMDIPTATKFLEQKVPMDHATAREEAITFSSSPGQAISYQIGKTQIQNLFSESINSNRDGFEIREFHDYVWLNGNVPVSLLKFEYLSDNSDLIKINR